MFTSVAICQPPQMLMVQEAWSKAFVTTDLMFFAVSDVKQGGLLEYIILYVHLCFYSCNNT